LLNSGLLQDLIQTRGKVQKGKRVRNKYVKGNRSKMGGRERKFWEEIITYFPSTQHGPHWRREVRGWEHTHIQGDLVSLLREIVGGGIDRQTDRQEGDLISFPIFFKTREKTGDNYERSKGNIW
jgi:hypothetical protein